MDPLVRIEDVEKIFFVGAEKFSLFQKKQLRAVDGVTFEVLLGEVLAIVGESGCGKTTLGLLLSRLEKPSSGQIVFRGINVSQLVGSRLKKFRRKVQIIFQDPYDSLDPRQGVLQTVIEPLKSHKIGSRKEQLQSVHDILGHVELDPPEMFVNKYPHELSGGQRQRVAIARSLILHPELLIADEPVSMLDASVRADIMNLMLKLKKEIGITIVFITHDLSAARYISDRILVMYAGKVVEIGPAEELIVKPVHPYTKLLLSAVSVPDPRVKRHRVRQSGNVPDPTDFPLGCRFHPRCSMAKDFCSKEDPSLQEVYPGHYAACHIKS